MYNQDDEEDATGQMPQSNVNPMVAKYLMQKQQQPQGPMLAQNGNSGDALSSIKNSLSKYISFGDKAQAAAAPIDVNPNQGGINFMNRGIAGNQGKRVPQRIQYNKNLNKTRITYSDGTTEERDGYAKP